MMVHMMSSADYDRYLDDQWERRYAEADAYVEWCEENDLDPDDDNEAAWEEYQRDQWEMAAEALAERQLDDDFDRYREGDW